MGVYRRGGKLWVSYTTADGRVRRSTGLSDTPANRAIAEKQYRAEATAEESSVVRESTLAEVVELYLDYQQTRVLGGGADCPPLR